MCKMSKWRIGQPYVYYSSDCGNFLSSMRGGCYTLCGGVTLKVEGGSLKQKEYWGTFIKSRRITLCISSKVALPRVKCKFE